MGKTLAALETTMLSSIIQRNTMVNNRQSNAFFMTAEVNGQIFADTNANGRQDRTENDITGVKLDLLSDEGAVVATTRAGPDGRYRFTSSGRRRM